MSAPNCNGRIPRYIEGWLNARTTDAQWSLFSMKSRTFGLGQTNWADKFWGIWVRVTCPSFPLFNYYLYKKLSFYIHIYLGLGFEFSIFQYLSKIEDIFPYCHDCPNSPKMHFGNLAFHISLYVTWDKSQKEKRTHKWRLVHFQITALARARCENGAITCIKSTIYKKRCFMFYGCKAHNIKNSINYHMSTV